MKFLKGFFLLVCLFSSIQGFCQEVQTLATFSTKSFRLGIITEKSIGNRWNYYGYSEMSRKHDTTAIELDLVHLANYKLYKGLVGTFGVGVSNDDVSPQIGLGFAKTRENFNIGFYPVLAYGINSQSFALSLNAIAEYTPKINDRWNFYSLLIMDLDNDFDDEFAASEFVSLGLMYKKKLQFGFNFDFYHEDAFETNEIEPGLFVGYSF